jgi:hypothetical protein
MDTFSQLCRHSWTPFAGDRRERGRVLRTGKDSVDQHKRVCAHPLYQSRAI